MYRTVEVPQLPTPLTRYSLSEAQRWIEKNDRVVGDGFSKAGLFQLEGESVQTSTSWSPWLLDYDPQEHQLTLDPGKVLRINKDDNLLRVIPTNRIYSITKDMTGEVPVHRDGLVLAHEGRRSLWFGKLTPEEILEAVAKAKAGQPTKFDHLGEHYNPGPMLFQIDQPENTSVHWLEFRPWFASSPLSTIVDSNRQIPSRLAVFPFAPADDKLFEEKVAELIKKG